MSVEMAKAPAYENTPEWKELLARHQKCVDNGEIALLELTPAAKNEKGQPVAYGGFQVMGKIKDKYKNLVLDTSLVDDRIGIAPMGISLRFDNRDNLRFIYAILNCPNLRDRCAVNGENPVRHRHRFILTDAQYESNAYAERREESIRYQNAFYSLSEPTVNLLCNIAGIPTKSSLGVKRADLCKVWENDADKKSKLKKMMDSPDIEYHIVANLELLKGNQASGEGLYKTANGVYKHNEQIIGNSIENVIGYLKQNDEVYFAFKKSNMIQENKKEAVAKPK